MTTRLSAPARETEALSADGSLIHAEVFGTDGRPTVVLAHGWTCRIDFWAEQTAALVAAGHRVVVYDQRGHGRTSLGVSHSTEVLADDLEAVLAATLAPGEKAVVAGHSMGAMTVMAAASRPAFREHVAAALLCSTGSARLLAESRILPLRAGRLRTALTGRILGAPGPLGPAMPLSRALLKYGTMGAATAPDRVRRGAAIIHACHPRARVAWSRVLHTLDLDAEVCRLDVPTAVLAGGADRLTPPVHARRIAEMLPRCTGLTVLPGIGHMVPLEAPGAVTAAVAELAAEYLDTTDTKEGAL